MSDKIDKVLSKLDKIQEDVTSLKIVQALQGKDIDRNTKDLSDHIEGVQQNRKRIEILEQPLSFKKAFTYTTAAFALILTAAKAITLLKL